MLLALCLLLGQRPLIVETAGPSRNGFVPHLRVTLDGATAPARVEYEVWLEAPPGALTQDGNLELVLAQTDRFQVTRLTPSGNHQRWRITQSADGPLDIPVPTARWKAPDGSWQEHTWPDPLSLHTRLDEAEKPSQTSIRQPQITPTAILIALGIIVPAILFTTGLSFGKPVGLERLLANPKLDSSWWTAVHRQWHAFLAESIEVQPGTGPLELVRRWEQASLPEPGSLLELSRGLEEFRFQPCPPDLTTCQAWITKAREWIALIQRESGKKPN